MNTSPIVERRHLRYRYPGQQIYQLVIEEAGDRQELANALVLNKSHSGFACVIIGAPIGADARVYHQENDKVRTPLLLRHQRRLAEEVQLLGFERTNTVIRAER